MSIFGQLSEEVEDPPPPQKKNENRINKNENNNKHNNHNIDNYNDDDDDDDYTVRSTLLLNPSLFSTKDNFLPQYEQPTYFNIVFSDPIPWTIAMIMKNISR